MGKNKEQKLILEKLKSKIGGLFAFQQQAIIPFAWQQVSQVKSEFLNLMNLRNIPNVNITSFMLDESEYLLITNTIQPGEKGIIAISFTSYGNDLIVSTYHFEQSSNSKFKNSILGLFLIILGILLIWTIFGLFIIWGGVVKILERFALSGDDKEQNEFFTKATIETLALAFRKCEINYRLDLAYTYKDYKRRKEAQ